MYGNDQDLRIDLRNPHFRQEPLRMHAHDMYYPPPQAPFAHHLAGLAIDVKPRLTKEQHDILEAHYQKQNKPNTQVKKNFADTLGVSLDKVNVRSSFLSTGRCIDSPRIGSRTDEQSRSKMPRRLPTPTRASTFQSFKPQAQCCRHRSRAHPILRRQMPLPIIWRTNFSPLIVIPLFTLILWRWQTALVSAPHIRATVTSREPFHPPKLATIRLR